MSKCAAAIRCRASKSKETALRRKIHIRAEDWMGLWLILVIGGGMAAFRQLTIVPFSMVGLCAAAGAPAICAPRGLVLWAAYEQIFGWAALALGAAGFCLGNRWAAMLAVAFGIAAVVNYNATTGVIGAALGLFAWVGLNTGRYKASV
jgi:hypothetical protein